MTRRDGLGDSLAAAIIAAHKRVGSQVALARETGASERTVKRWEKGSVPSRRYRPTLIALGVPESLFVAADEREQIEKRLRAVEAEVARIRELLA